jgi:4-hydroxy-2-oxoheptanedioate aldolase
MNNSLFNYENKIKNKLLKGEIAIGAFLLSANTFIAEAMANSNLDWILIDMEASHATKEDALHILQALNAYDVTPIIRIPEHNKHLIEFALDIGSKGIMIPKINSLEEAKEIVKACYYPPMGDRGMNCIRASGYYNQSVNYIKNANNSILSIFQIESKESIEHITEIAQVDNVDVLFMGLGDLSASYGLMGNIIGKEIDEARQKVIEACDQYNKIPGIFAHSETLINQYIAEGFKFIAIGNDIKFLNQGLIQSLKSFS